MTEREPRRYQVNHVPAQVRDRDRLIGLGEPVLQRYERITFEKSLMAPPSQPPAAFVCPGHPLLDATIDLTIERHRSVLRQSSVLVDDNDGSNRPRVLMYLEHSIQDGSRTRSGEQRTVSKRMLHVEVDPELETVGQDYAPYLDYRPLSDGEPGVQEIVGRPECSWIGGNLEAKAVEFAVSRLVPTHLEEVRSRKVGTPLKDRGGSQGTTDQGDRLLGPSGRRSPLTGASREAERTSQLLRSPS